MIDLKPDDVSEIVGSKKRKALDELEDLHAERERTKFERGDLLALIIAGFTTIFPLVLFLLLLYYVITKLVFRF